MRSLLLAVVASLALVAGADAQTTSGSFTGTVLDAQGAPMAVVMVTVKNVETNVAYTTRTEPSGDFVMANLPPAKYCS